MIEIKDYGCVMEAIKLKIENNDLGSVYVVRTIKKQPIDHAYYVPDETKLEEIALNQEDNGFPQYPKLKVHEVLRHGTKYF